MSTETPVRVTQIGNTLRTIGDMIDEVMRHQQLQPTKERQAALAMISEKVRELEYTVEAAHILP